MDSKESQNKLQAQIQSLHSGNKSAILTTLKELRSLGNVSILPDLFQVMLVQEDEQIVGELTNFLNDLKDPEAAEVLAKAVANPEYKAIQTVLTAACWQNGLAYGKHLGIFAEVLITADYVTALEAYTVLEEAIGEVEAVERQKLSYQLKSKLDKVDKELKPLVVAMVNTIDSY